MMRTLQAFTSLLLVTPFALALGCSDGGSDGEGGGHATGHASGSTTTTTSSAGGSTATTTTTTTTSTTTSTTSAASSSSSGDPSGGRMTWEGTWSVHLTYDIECVWAGGATHTASHDQTNAMQLVDNGNGGLTADIMYYEMSGTGTSRALNLSGQYPVQDENSDTASNVRAQNNVTLTIDTLIDHDDASGAVSGLFEGSFGQKCTIKNGKAAVAR